MSTRTACLAKDACGVPAEQQKINLVQLPTANACIPGGSCC